MTVVVRQVPFGRIEFEQREPTNAGDRGYRAYHIVDTDGKRRRVPSVTTALDVLSKRALLRWYEQMGVETALAMERAGTLKNVAIDDAAELLRSNGLGAEAHMKTAQQRGVSVHAVLQRYAENGEAPNPAGHPPEHRGYIKALVRWLLAADRQRLEIEAVERLVAHPTHNYAGRLDLRAKLGGLSHVIDLKTNRTGRVWVDHHYQPAAYALADEACGAEPVFGTMIVAVGADGTYEQMRSVATPADFLAVLDAYRRNQRLDSAVAAERKRAEAQAA